MQKPEHGTHGSQVLLASDTLMLSIYIKKIHLRGFCWGWNSKTCRYTEALPQTCSGTFSHPCLNTPARPTSMGRDGPSLHVCAVAGAITAPCWLDALLYVKQQQSLHNAACAEILLHLGVVITTHGASGREARLLFWRWGQHS